jgi:hypothetical protein
MLLARWGLLELVAATWCPPIHTYGFDFGTFTISRGPGTPQARRAGCHGANATRRGC